jgi:filamentous hemagglutinin family protein
MLKALFTWLGLSLCTLGYLGSPNNSVVAQVTSDGTVNTQVTENGKTAEITGGETREGNLFHSFEDFSVKTGNEAFFNNADSISNIFSRVTGGNRSDIDGAIRANGSANLFLINPAGILFGENASLNIGGSFYGSSASSILFENGEFSATDLDNPPLLTVNAPIGLGFRDQPGDITVRGDGQGTREQTDDLIDTENALRVDSDKTFALVGGKINLEGATIKTPGGRIELGSLQGNQQINLTRVNRGFGLDYLGVQNFQDIQLYETATIDASGLVAGDIQVQGNNISLTEGSQIEASTLGDSPSQETPGTIKINAADTIKIDGLDSSNSFPSAISSLVYSGAVGNSGKLNLRAVNLSLANSGQVNADTFGKGDAGSIDINATKSINLDNSLIEDAVGKDATGNGGKLNITTANLSLAKDSYITAATVGKGDAGSIDINAAESINLDNSSIDNEVRKDAEGNSGNLNITTANLSVTGFLSTINAETLGQGEAGLININATKSITLDKFGEISTSVTTDGEGNGGDINITTPDLTLTNGGQVSASNFGQGNAGNLNITTANLSVTGFLSSINVDTFGKGDSGSIDINATKSITLGGDGFGNSISTSVTSDGEGNGGDINITTPNLSLNKSGSIDASTSGQGEGGNITIDVADTLSINDANVADADLTTSTGIFASNLGDGDGDAGNIDITASKLSLINGGQINSFTRGKGNAGNTTINAQDSIVLSGEDSGDGFPSAIFNSVYGAARGNGGTISITTKDLDIVDGADISAFSEGQGDAGLIDINANILSLDNGEISAQAFNNVNGGNLKIDANIIVAYPNGNSDIFANAEQGNGGNINIEAESVLGIEERSLNDSTNDINASSDVSGLDGRININTSDINPVQGATELPSNVIEAKQTADQTCSANRKGKTNNGLAIAGKGGISPAPNTPLNSENINNEPVQASIPQPLETSQGKFQPARGIMVTESGKIALTAYRTNNAGERIPEAKVNCGQI